MSAVTAPELELDLDYVTEVFGDPDSARPMLEYFLDTVEAEVGGLTQLSGPAHAATLRARIHSIGGAARTAGARRLGELCAALEADLIAGRLEGTTDGLKAIGSSFDRVRSIIRSGAFHEVV